MVDEKSSDDDAAPDEEEVNMLQLSGTFDRLALSLMLMTVTMKAMIWLSATRATLAVKMKRK